MRTAGIEGTLINENMVFGLAVKTQLFVIDGRVYYCSGRRIAGSNTFHQNRRVFGVKEGPCLEVLEKISDKKLNQTYLQYQEEFISEELKKSSGSYSRTYKDLVGFVVKEIFPYLRKDDSENLDSVFGISSEKKESVEVRKNKAYEREIEKFIETRISELQGNNVSRRRRRSRSARSSFTFSPRISKLDSILLEQDLSRSSRDNSLLSRLMNGFDFAINNNEVCALNTLKRGGDLKLNGVNYVLSPAGSLSDLQKSFAFEIINKLSIEALRYKLKESKEFQELINEREDIVQLCTKDKYHEQDFGLEKRYSNYIVVYVKVPDYVLKSPHDDNLYKFKGHKLGIELGYSEDRKEPQLTKNPFALTNVSGPFYESGCTSLCMGHYNKDYFNQIPLGKACARLLVDGRNVVLKGYQRGSNPHRSLDGQNFSSKKISPTEVKRQGLQITNINCQRRGYNDYY